MLPTHVIQRALPYLLLLAVIALADCSVPPITVTLKGDLPLIVPRSALAGEPLQISIGPVPEANGKTVGLVMIGSHGPRVYSSVFQAGTAYFDIPSTDTTQPGYLTFVAAVDEARGKAGVLLVAERSAAISNPERGIVGSIRPTCTADALGHLYQMYVDMPLGIPILLK